jgi:hypothetical protein
MRRAATWRLLGFPSLDEGPIKVREKGASVSNHRIMLKQSGDDGLVKDLR